MTASGEKVFFDIHDFVVSRPQKTWLDGHFAHLSASSLGMFRRCPRQFQQRDLFGRKEPPGEGLVIGSFFHETLSFNYGQKIVSHEDRPLSEMIEFLTDKAIPDVLNASGGESEVRWDEGSSLEKARSDATRITSSYHQIVLPRMQPVAVEQRFEWHVGAPVPLIGYLDTILADRAVDTKTGKQAPSKLKPGWRFQADIYSGHLGKPIEYQTINRAAQPKIVTGLESDALVVRPSHNETEQLKRNIQMMVGMIEWMYREYGLDQPWPTWGRTADWSQSILPCDYCGFRNDPCPAWA
jgi:hypothetical protein